LREDDSYKKPKATNLLTMSLEEKNSVFKIFGFGTSNKIFVQLFEVGLSVFQMPFVLIENS
jgi:hypothetical protein